MLVKLAVYVLVSKSQHELVAPVSPLNKRYAVTIVPVVLDMKMQNKSRLQIVIVSTI